MKTFLADLHIHTGLSPCAADEMTPPAIVNAAVRAGLDLIAICDHNAAANAGATLLAGEGRIGVLAGMEITTAEEVHVVGIFPGAISALAAAEEVLETLPVGNGAYRQRFGPQRIMDDSGRITGFEDHMLAVAGRLDLAATVELIHRHNGVAIAAHVNRPSFSVLSQLGVFPEDAGFDAVEVFTPCSGTGAEGPRGQGAECRAAGTRVEDIRPDRVKAGPHHARVGRAQRVTSTPAQVRRKALGPLAPRPLGPWREYSLPVLASSDSHFLADIGRCRTALRMNEPSFDEFVLALRGEGGRGVEYA